MKDQNQSSGDESVNIQAGTIVFQGVSATEARQIALDVYQANFMNLAGVARSVAQDRAEEITEKFIKELQGQNPEGFKQAIDPDFQHSLFNMQKEFARSGDQNLGDLLVEILVDRSKHPTRDILQIVLNESLTVAPKLTNDQLSALSIIFLFKYTISNAVNNLESLFDYLDQHVKPFAGSLNKRQPCYQHLEYSGCGTVSLGSIELEELVRKQYGGVVSKGCSTDAFEAKLFGVSSTHPMFTRCLNNPTHIQVNAINEDTIKAECQKHGIVDPDYSKIISMHNETTMSNEEIKNLIIASRPYMADVFDIWSTSSMKHFTLTSVGIAIGHAYVKKDVGEFTDLGIWIN